MADYVTVFRGYDPIQTELLGELLRDGEIDARVTGTRNGALVGVAQNILEISIQVPRSQAAAAADFLEAYFESDGEALLEEQMGETWAADDDDDDDDADSEVALRPVDRQSPLFAAGSTLLIFGGSHLYCGRYLTAAALGAAQVWAIRMMISDTWRALMIGVSTFAALLLVDAIHAQFAVRQNQRGVRVPLWRELAAGLGMAALAILIGSAVGPKIPKPEKKSGGPAQVQLAH